MTIRTRPFPGYNAIFAPVADLATSPTIDGGAGDDILIIEGSGVLQADAFASTTGVEVVLASRQESLIGPSPVQFTLLDTMSDQGIVVSAYYNSVVDGHFLQNNALLYEAGIGYDAVRGGARNDAFVFSHPNSLDQDAIWGEDGYDWLIMDTPADLTAADLQNVQVEEIRMDKGGDLDLRGATAAMGLHAIDLLQGFGGDVLTLDAAEVLAIGQGGTLHVIGDASDAVHMGSGWSRTATGMTDLQFPNVAFDRYEKGAAFLFIEAGVLVA